MSPLVPLSFILHNHASMFPVLLFSDTMESRGIIYAVAVITIDSFVTAN